MSEEIEIGNQVSESRRPGSRDSWKWVGVLVLLLSFVIQTSGYSQAGSVQNNTVPVKYLIVLIGDGMGMNHLLAERAYSGILPEYQTWPQYWVSTYSVGGGYDSIQAWTDFSYVKTRYTDSAAGATALFTGVKTFNGRIAVSADGSQRLFSLADQARQMGKAIGTVSSVPISHATPAGWLAHNDSRVNGYAIADEELWGDPNTTGTTATHSAYSGDHGPSWPPADVVIGGGHPVWSSDAYVNSAIRDKLFDESDIPGAFTFVERVSGSPDGGTRLLEAANRPATLRLVGLFGGNGGNLEPCLADGLGCNPENPTLAEMTLAALTVLSRYPSGFTVMIEGGAIDWGAHNNNLNQVIGEVKQFNAAIQTAIDWINDPASPADWDNTLVVITADHETGYLTAAPEIFPDQPLGVINTNTLALEKTVIDSGRRASWQDSDGDSKIDADETVYWSWNSNTHTNSLVPLFAKGAGDWLFASYTTNSDPVRGSYLDNTDVNHVMKAALTIFRYFLPAIQRQE